MTNKPAPIIRYSPRASTEYCPPSAKLSPMLDKDEIWNLAYLSHNYEAGLYHPDPSFEVCVRRTCQTNLRTGVPDLTWGAIDGTGLRHLLAAKLRMPAPQFVRWLLNQPSLLHSLPLYQAYGGEWVRTLMARSFVCHTYDHVMPPEPEVTSLDLAESVLKPYRIK